MNGISCTISTHSTQVAAASRCALHFMTEMRTASKRMQATETADATLQADSCVRTVRDALCRTRPGVGEH
jgi:hypothetical protein